MPQLSPIYWVVYLLVSLFPFFVMAWLGGVTEVCLEEGSVVLGECNLVNW